MVFVVAVLGDALAEACAAVSRLASCSLEHVLQLPRQAALQPGGATPLLAARWRCYHDAASDTLWVAVAAGTQPLWESSDEDASPDSAAQRRGATHAALLACLTSHAVLWLAPPQTPAAAATRGLLPGATDLLARLRLLQQLKVALLPALPALLGVPAAEAHAALPGLAQPWHCTPQLTVLAQVQAAAADAAAGGGPAADEARLQAAEEEAERQMRRLLKRCRVLLPPDSARALAALPTASPLVLRLSEHLGSGGSQEQHVAAALADLALPSGPAQQQQQAAARASPAAAVAAALAPQRAAVTPAPEVSAWQKAVAAIGAVLHAAALKASSSSGGGGSASGAAEAAPTVAVPAEATAAVAWQEACSDTVRQFSLASCKRAAAVASEAYRRNTPPLLPAPGHAVALQAALRLYRSLARGPTAAAGEAALSKQLDAFWRDGRQQCEAVSLLGNPCRLPVHDPQRQPHTSSAQASERPTLLLATGSGAQQHRIVEPFSVAELTAAAAAVATDAASAAARAQFYVRRLGAAGEGAGPAAAAAAAAVLGGSPDAEEAGARPQLSGGHGSDDDEAAAAVAGGAAAAEEGAEAAPAPASAAGAPAAGCWLEVHALGPRSMFRSPALAAALVLDGQPGWLRAGGCMFGVLPLLVSTPGQPGQQQQRGASAAASPANEEFPSLQDLQEREQRRRPAPAPKQAPKSQQQQRKGKPQPPRLLNWPAAPEEAAAAAVGSGAAQRALGRGGAARLQGHGGKQQQQAAAAAAAGADTHCSPDTLLLGVEYESSAGQRLLLTPALLAAAVQSSLDAVSVRQHASSPAAVAAGPGPRTSAAAAAAAGVQPSGAAAAFLQQDLPLFLQLPGEQVAQLAGKRRSAPGSSAGASGGPVWLQLRRLLVGMPEAAVQLEAAPRLLVEVPCDMLAPAGAAGAAGSGGPRGSSPSPPRTVQLQYSVAVPLPLPPSTFCVLALPWLLTAPMLAPGSSSSGGGGGPTALIRQSGPLRAVLLSSAVRPAPVPAEAEAS